MSFQTALNVNGAMFFKVLVLFCALNCKLSTRGSLLREEFTWSKISYDIPTLNDDGNSYIYQNNIPMGANRWKDKLFITVPRRNLGIPSTLNYISYGERNRRNVPLKPYPDYRNNKFEFENSNDDAARSDDSFISVYRVAVDVCDRLWFVDTGHLDFPGNRTRVRSPYLIVINLNTDKITRRYAIPESNLISISNLVSLTVDANANQCSKSFAYIPDFKGYGLIVYSFSENDSWRISHNYFFLHPLAGEFFVGGKKFQWNDGLFSVALAESGKGDEYGYRTAYFHALAGTHLFSVSTQVLQNRSLATRRYHEDDFKVVGNRGKNSQTSASDLHKSSGILFLGLVNQNALGCWNTNRPFRPTNFGIVQRNDEKMIYPSDVKVHQDEVLVLTNAMPLSIYDRLDFDKVNFRVWVGNVYDVTGGTICQAMK